jgi:glycosyltransferase A (GT-A) superfamily protein (DUF2064 family)
VPPALLVLVDDPDAGVPGVTDDPSVADALLQSTLDLARRVGGVGRVLLFHPPEAEAAIAARALGFRLWPQVGATPAERYANAFRQAGELGYDGAVVIGLNVPTFAPERLSDAARMLDEHQGVIADDGRGGVALLGLQRPEPTLFPSAATDVPGYEEVVTRAKQQLVRLVEVGTHEALDRDTVHQFLAASRGE